MARILLIDDDPDLAESLRDQLARAGHEVRWVDLAEDGLRLLAAPGAFDAVLLDNKMPRMSGLDFLAALKQRGLGLPVILMTGAHSDQTVLQAMNRGAFAYVIKPDEEERLFDELAPALREALEVSRPVKRVAIDKADDAAADDSVIVGRSKPLLKALASAGKWADLDETVLILGETGTGKELFARAIHTNSRRQRGPFVVVNCAAVTESLLASELFGHEPGAFTGADKLRKGRFEHAHGGTLFLDEVGELPAAAQAGLLRVLQERSFERVGGNDSIAVDVRVVAATHRDLRALVQQGKFRQDLLYRLEGMTLHLPPLRERPEDVEPLARRFVARIAGDGKSGPALHPLALERLRGHAWPGNVRQLQKVICRAVGSCRGPEIRPEDVDFGEPDPPLPRPSVPANEAEALAALRGAIAWAWEHEPGGLWPALQERLERELLRLGLERGLSEVKLAERLGVARNTVRARIKQYELKADGE